jgi:hypothetical protein
VTLAGSTTRWLLAGEGDDRLHQNTVGHWWRKTLNDAGLSGVKLRDLRRSNASGPHRLRCDVVTVQRSLRPTKATETLNTYAHLWPTADDRPAWPKSRTCLRLSGVQRRPSSQTT